LLDCTAGGALMITGFGESWVVPVDSVMGAGAGAGATVGAGAGEGAVIGATAATAVLAPAEGILRMVPGLTLVGSEMPFSRCSSANGTLWRTATA